MKFEKLIIHEVNWPHANLIILTSAEYPELGILAFGEHERGREIDISLPGFRKPLNLSLPCGCCIPHLVGTNAYEGSVLAEQLRHDFIMVLRSCCKKNGISKLVFLEFYGDELWMERDEEGLHLIDPYYGREEIDLPRFKSAFTELRLNLPGLRPEDL